jgi:NADH-quinone oxidoreductase subunit A
VLQIRDVIRAYLPAIVFVVLGIGLGAVFATLNSVLGPKPKHRRAATAEPYESGLPSEVKKSMRFGISFYLVAMLFILFDIETIFLFPVAVQLKAFGAFALAEISVFIVLLFVAFVYVWRRGALAWK